jgi:NADH-quinone oxidoreductase subunit F
VFAGGDLVTGPNTVVNAIAAGRKAAGVIDRYLHGKELVKPPELKLPSVFIEPAVVSDEELEDAERVEPATLNAKSRKESFAEVEMALSVEQAIHEAQRCLRCDLEFTQRSENEEAECVAVEEKSA